MDENMDKKWGKQQLNTQPFNYYIIYCFRSYLLFIDVIKYSYVDHVGRCPFVCQNVLKKLSNKGKQVEIDWLVVLRINVALAIFQPYCDLEAGDNQSLKS